MLHFDFEVSGFSAVSVTPATDSQHGGVLTHRFWYITVLSYLEYGLWYILTIGIKDNAEEVARTLLDRRQEQCREQYGYHRV